MEINVQLGDDDLLHFKDLLSKSKSKISDADQKTLKKIVDTKQCTVDDLIVVQRAVKQGRVDQDRPFRLHEFLERSKVQVPSLPKAERNPELEARCQRLRAQVAEKEYREMTRNVDAVMHKDSSLSQIGREVRVINRHLITLFNMLFTVVGSFIFAYMGTQYVYPSGPGAFVGRLGAGLVTATIVFFADLYFVVRTLDEDAYETTKKTK